MLERLQEAVADIEQLKADLLSTSHPSKHTAQPAAAVKKKRKAQSMATGVGMRRGRAQVSKLKPVPDPVLGPSHVGSQGPLFV